MKKIIAFINPITANAPNDIPNTCNLDKQDEYYIHIIYEVMFKLLSELLIFVFKGVPIFGDVVVVSTGVFVGNIVVVSIGDQQVFVLCYYYSKQSFQFSLIILSLTCSFD